MKYYAIKAGLKAPSITTTWKECSALVKGFSKAAYKSFSNIEDALSYLELSDKDITIPHITTKTTKTTKTTMPKEDKISLKNIYDGDRDKSLIDSLLAAKIKSLNKEELRVYTDGSCINQGNSDRSSWKAGSGIYIPLSSLNLPEHNKDLSEEIKIGLKINDPTPENQTNNRAELYPIVWILCLLYEIITIDGKKDFKIVIHSDSTYAINNLDSKNTKHLDLWKLLKETLQKLRNINVQIEFVKEPAHSGVYGNEMADQIAGLYAAT